MLPRENQPERIHTIFTIGHSTHSIDEFVKLLESNQIELLIDIRTIPKSRHNPQFNSEALAAALQSCGIAYSHMKGLGGLRKPRVDSMNQGWRNASFRGYADYMQTPAFIGELQKTIQIAGTKRTVLMCAEAVPWRCHRSLVADALLVRGFTVKDIISAAAPKEHALTPFAVVHGTEIIYPIEKNQSEQLPLLRRSSTEDSE